MNKKGVEEMKKRKGMDVLNSIFIDVITALDSKDIRVLSLENKGILKIEEGQEAQEISLRIGAL